jgi:hypothetical protein
MLALLKACTTNGGGPLGPILFLSLLSLVHFSMFYGAQAYHNGAREGFWENIIPDTILKGLCIL